MASLCTSYLFTKEKPTIHWSATNESWARRELTLVIIGENQCKQLTTSKEVAPAFLERKYRTWCNTNDIYLIGIGSDWKNTHQMTTKRTMHYDNIAIIEARSDEIIIRDNHPGTNRINSTRPPRTLFTNKADHSQGARSTTKIKQSRSRVNDICSFICGYFSLHKQTMIFRYLYLSLLEQIFDFFAVKSITATIITGVHKSAIRPATTFSSNDRNHDDFLAQDCNCAHSIYPKSYIRLYLSHQKSKFALVR